ncbi:hypothetical protein ACFROC_38425 [Nocardia tengchongensis]|uniref:hypothetical protein n=1 Tax=Nocardia tengchongensis TaxID=2055889 RepID=UPI00368B9131
MAKPRPPKKVAKLRSQRTSLPKCHIVLDGWRPDLASWLWTHPRAIPLRNSFIRLAQELAKLVDQPESVQLVIAVNLADAVQARENNPDYNVQRGSGTVGARTMPVGDGIDVVVDGNKLIKMASNGMPIPDPAGVNLMHRTLVHEAQHVIMRQRRSGFEIYGRDEIDGWIAVHMFDIAAKMCDEYRAEFNAIGLTSSSLPQTSDILDVLNSLGTQLTAVEASYQASRNVDALLTQVLKVCGHCWTALAYWAAQWRYAETLPDLPEEVAELALWQRYFGDTWAAFAQAFARVPIDLTTTPSELRTAALDLAKVLDTALETVGFEYDDGPNRAFYIRRFDFPGEAD